MTDSSVMAPFTSTQVQSLNDYQKAGVFHEFTCVNRSTHPDDAALVATESGWVCEHCDYTQNWAHAWMTDDSWRPAAKDLRELLGQA